MVLTALTVFTMKWWILEGTQRLAIWHHRIDSISAFWNVRIKLLFAHWVLKGAGTSWDRTKMWAMLRIQIWLWKVVWVWGTDPERFLQMKLIFTGPPCCVEIYWTHGFYWTEEWNPNASTIGRQNGNFGGPVNDENAFIGKTRPTVCWSTARHGTCAQSGEGNFEIVGRFQNPTGVNYFDGLQIYEMQWRCWHEKLNINSHELGSHYRVPMTRIQTKLKNSWTRH